ncbi:hypothetical protein H0A36_01760 [Endozoicomonas sp. SM1973]|uniref:Uncharacterized protein n=2 Tax=Spartinivicinus marinus TaxID=2994442 RepID=A0A853HTW1_9GAMM|nr:hypothetical protein [Spartinivicinus marinus]NYZ64713.1 hypothetical protein [Spartinivicinus marinus]
MINNSLKIHTNINDSELFVEFSKRNVTDEANKYCINIQLPVVGYGTINQSIPLADDDVNKLFEFLSPR